MATAKKVATKKAPAKKTPVQHSIRKSVLPENNPAATDLDLGTVSTTTEDRLAEIEVIDLRKLPPVGRVALFSSLESLGYLERLSLQPVLSDDIRTVIGLFKADAVRLNHTNKLLVLTSWDDVKDSYAISRIDIQVHVGIEFSTPGPVDPDYMSFGDSHYVRVPVEVRDATMSALTAVRQAAGQPK